jgi:ABC transport system ATP-binding/permease protein
MQAVKLAEKSTADPVSPASAVAASRKLSFKERHALDTLPSLVDAMGRDIAKLTAVLAEPGLYTRDRNRYDKASAMLADLETKRAASEEEWLRLEMMREEVEG